MVRRETFWFGFVAFFGAGAALGIVFSLHIANRGASAPGAILFGAALGAVSLWMLARYTYCIQRLVRNGRWPRDPNSSLLSDGMAALIVGLPLVCLFVQAMRELIGR